MQEDTLHGEFAEFEPAKSCKELLNLAFKAGKVGHQPTQNHA